MNTAFYDSQRLAFPKSVSNATALTKTGELDTKRYGGPGTRSKNPRRFDSAKKEG